VKRKAATNKAMAPAPLTAAIYARVSTKDKGQDTENQLAQLRRYAERQSWTIREFIDHESGKHSDRAGFQRLFDSAARRQIDVVLVWALDRFSREGVAETFIHIRRLLDHGVQFESYSEPHFRTTGPAGELMIAIAAWIAKQERIRISERTKAGLAVARAKGKRLGRPIKIVRRDQVREARAAGDSLRVIGRRFKISTGTVRKILAAAV
jgi:DNA invertase Pin-like site-specific DNA recombinase